MLRLGLPPFRSVAEKEVFSKFENDGRTEWDISASHIHSPDSLTGALGTVLLDWGTSGKG